jgi:hypothetical protein
MVGTGIDWSGEQLGRWNPCIPVEDDSLGIRLLLVSLVIVVGGYRGLKDGGDQESTSRVLDQFERKIQFLHHTGHLGWLGWCHDLD